MNEKEKLEHYAWILRGLIHYHERMMVGMDMISIVSKNGEVSPCAKNNKCPAVMSADIYLEALKEALRLMEKEIKNQ